MANQRISEWRMANGEIANGKSQMTFDGFWLPAGLRERVLANAVWQIYWLKGGVISAEEMPGAVTVRWPRLTVAQWRELLTGLQQGRPVGGREVLARWQAVLVAAQAQLLAQAETLLPLLAAATGYSPEMLAAALWQGNLISPASLSAALHFQPAWSVASRWERMADLPGWVRFFPERTFDHVTASLRRGARLCRPAAAVDMALGYAAGNVPGTALLIALLGGLANFALGDAVPSPAVLIRNSRHEPLFAAWVLSAVEALDPDLVAGLAVLIWDYDEEALQREVLGRAGLMIAAAGDDTIAALDSQRAKYAAGLRFHRHGHKVSFAVIGELEASNWKLEPAGKSAMPGTAGHVVCNPQSAIPRLAALDSSLWDQNGCLSPRVHFVTGDADAYAQALAGQMRELVSRMPRGTTPRRFVHRAFDAYMSLAGAGGVRVYSTYDDDFMVATDPRPWDAETLSRAVNACTGRTIIVRPVEDVMEVPCYLRWLPARNLQSLSVAMDGARVLTFAQAAGACGVTAVRSLGRAAFPQLAYSWDGLLPLDVGHVRPAGHFTTVEFDHLEDELAVMADRWGM
jgi:hypothetical protein